ncbi:hypothetical protein E4T42_06121 [Aureobasidium subglaciale]|nr:hypothetical protein E4T42_06121 [Aureobasidium subglaciale]
MSFHTSRMRTSIDDMSGPLRIQEIISTSVIGNDSSTSPSLPPSFSAFQRLPAELKLLVCENAVTRSEPIDLSRKCNQTLPEITRVTKFFHMEGSRLYYSMNTFLLPLSHRLGHEEQLNLDAWLWADTNLHTHPCTKMNKIVAQILLPPERNNLMTLILLATHFSDLSSVEAKKTIKLQPMITTPTGLEAITPVSSATRQLEEQISSTF